MSGSGFVSCRNVNRKWIVSLMKKLVNGKFLRLNGILVDEK